MKKVIFFLVLVFLSSNFLFSQTNESKKAAFQLSFVPPLSTQGMQASEYTNAVSLNMLVGVSRNVTSFSMSGIGMYVSNDIGGLHISGLGTYAGNSGDGILISGLFNKTKDFRGFEISGLMNIAHNMTGVQIAGLANIAENVDGFQFAGLVNIAKDVYGLQFAVINFAESNDYPLGLVNIIKNNGEMSIGLTYNEIGSTILSFRSGGRILYGIVGLGYNHKFEKRRFIVEGGFGAHIPISSRFRINNELRVGSDLKSSSSMDFSDKKGGTSHGSFAIMPAFKIFPECEIFGGPSLNYLYTDYLDNNKMFPNNNIWKKYTNKELQQVYFGFSIGAHYIF